jgi:predicted small secreted protein
MKPTVEDVIKQYNIRLYNGSWYVTEKQLRKVLEEMIEVYNAGMKARAEEEQ